MPTGTSWDGNEALSWVRTTGLSGDSRSRPRSSRSDSSDGIVEAGGARNIVFSTLAWTIPKRSRLQRRRRMLDLAMLGGGEEE